MTIARVTVFGGSGFLGRYIVQRLARQGAIVRVAVRHPEEARFLQPMGDVGQIVPVRADLRDGDQVARALEGVDAAVNAVSLYIERGKTKFADIHETGARDLARAATAAGVERLVHISGIGADRDAQSRYAQSRFMGDRLVREAFGGVTILKPSILFGPEDAFFNALASIARISPVLPLFGLRRTRQPPFVDGGFTRFQPVYAGDVAGAVAGALMRNDARGRTFELGGPAVYSFRELSEFVLRETGRRCLLVPWPFWAASVNAWFLKMLPDPPLTPDQVTLLKRDNVVGAKAPGLADLGVTPSALELIAPAYLARYRRGGRAGAARLA